MRTVLVMNYRRVSAESRQAIADALADMGRHDLAERLPAADLRIAADVVGLIDEAAAAFAEGRSLDGLTAAERAVDPKWPSAADSQQAYAKADWEGQPLASGVAA